MISRRFLIAGATASTALVAVGCTGPGPQSPDSTEPPRVDPNTHQVVARTPGGDLTIPGGPEGALKASRDLLAAATAVVVVVPDATASASPSPSASPTASGSPRPSASTASPSGTPTPSPSGTPHEAPAADSAAAEVARALGVPLFEDSPDLAAELDRLQTRTIIAYGGTPRAAGSREVVPGPATAGEVTLPGLPAKAQAPKALVLAQDGVHPATLTTVAASGLELTPLPGPHPGSTKESTEKVRAFDGPVIGVGDGMGDDGQWADAVAVTRTATPMTSGAVAPFPEHHMIALYGHPQTESLGMMGEQPPEQAVERLKKYVEEYRALMPDKTVIGSFEIITTVASSAPGPQGDYSYRTPNNLLMPWIEAAHANDLYVVLDLQPGRSNFLDQAKELEDLLKHPHVGLALDPEWRLPPDGKHLVQIGQVDVAEVNQVGAWLADFVRANKLPPKVLTLHQFQVRMITNRSQLDTSRPEVQYLVHVDGQGGQQAKQATWGVIQKNLPPRVWLGWKNFEDEDKPMLTPAQTVEQVHPTPHFVSYQ